MRDATIKAILTALRSTMRGATAHQLTKMLGWHYSATKARLLKLTELGVIKRRTIPRASSHGRPQYRYSAGRRINA